MVDELNSTPICKECGGRRFMEMQHINEDSPHNPCPQCILELEEKVDRAVGLLEDYIVVFDTDEPPNRYTEAVRRFLRE